MEPNGSCIFTEEQCLLISNIGNKHLYWYQVVFHAEIASDCIILKLLGVKYFNALKVIAGLASSLAILQLHLNSFLRHMECIVFVSVVS